MSLDQARRKSFIRRRTILRAPQLEDLPCLGTKCPRLNTRPARRACQSRPSACPGRPNPSARHVRQPLMGPIGYGDGRASSRAVAH
jgi:hypothetical protein